MMNAHPPLNPIAMIESIEQAPHVPVFEVRDTLHKYGRYDPQTKTVTVSDLIKFHGHLCGGLMEATMALRAAFDTLFPAGVIDRTDLAIVSGNSACGGDAADYLSGARSRFGSHSIDLFGRLQWDYAWRLVQRSASESFTVERLSDFVWPHPTCENLGRRSDNDFKDEL